MGALWSVLAFAEALHTAGRVYWSLTTLKNSAALTQGANPDYLASSLGTTIGQYALVFFLSTGVPLTIIFVGLAVQSTKQAAHEAQPRH